MLVHRADRALSAALPACGCRRAAAAPRGGRGPALESAGRRTSAQEDQRPHHPDARLALRKVLSLAIGPTTRPGRSSYSYRRSSSNIRWRVLGCVTGASTTGTSAAAASKHQWWRTIRAAARVQSRPRAEDEIVRLVDGLCAAGGVRALLLECTNLPPYKQALKARFDIEIFDILTLIDGMKADIVDPAHL